jgi:hypothetical protein
MDKLNKEYIDLLSEDVNPTEKFWRLDKRIKLADACLITYSAYQ